MTNVPFDALAVTRVLRTKGFDSGQAEAITEAVRAGVSGGVASKADLAELRADLMVLRGDIKAIQPNLFWMKIIGGAMAGAMAGAIAWLCLEAYDTNAALATVQADMAAVRADVAMVRADIAAVRADIAMIKDAIAALGSGS